MAQFDVRPNIRQHQVPSLGSLLESVGVPDEAGFAPRFAEETKSESGYDKSMKVLMSFVGGEGKEIRFALLSGEKKRLLRYI